MAATGTWAGALALALLTGGQCSQPSPPPEEIVVGRVTGRVAFEPRTAAIDAHLAAHPGTGDVRVYLQADASAFQDQPAAGGLPDVARFAIDVPAEDPTRVYAVSTGEARFGASHSRYRFGAHRVGAAARHPCGPVPASSGVPEGITCDVIECAALLPVRVRFEGPAEDIDALDPSQDVSCTVGAEQADSGWSTPQLHATLALRAPVGDFRSAGVAGSFLVLADDLLEIGATCFASPLEPGFPLSGDQAVFHARAVRVATTCGAGGSEIELVVQVRRDAGVMTGLFDISGHDELEPRVNIDGPSWHPVRPDAVPADSEPDPSAPWRAEGLLPGDFTIQCRTWLDGGMAFLSLPKLGGLNGAIQVEPNASVDLGRTLVVRPRAVDGTVTLRDLGATRLRDFVAAPVSDFQGSSVTAHGASEIAPGGVSGDMGVAMASLQGSCDPAVQSAELRYTLLVGGLNTTGSPPGYEPLHGRDARPAPWDVDEVDLLLPDVGNECCQRTTITLLEDRRVTATPPQSAADPPIEVSPFEACLGELEHVLRIDPAIGLLRGPELGVSDTGPALLPPSGSVAPWQLRWAGADGVPRTNDPPLPEARVLVTLPEGTQALARAWVTLVPASGGSSARLGLAERRLLAGRIACGTSSTTCATILDVLGNSRGLDVALDPPAPQCVPPGEVLGLVAIVRSDGAAVDRVETSWDAGAPETACAPCGADPEVAFETIVPSPGLHVLRVRVFSSGCDAAVESWIQVAEPVIACVARVEAWLRDAEASIAAQDPRVAAALAPQVIGSCEPLAATMQALPAFPEGETEVIFTAPGAAPCATIVAVRRSVSQIAYAEGSSVKLARLEDGAAMLSMATASPPSDLTFSRDGSRLVVLEGDRLTLLRMDGTDVSAAIGGWRVDGHPSDPDTVAVVGPAPGGGVRLAIRWGATGLVTTADALSGLAPGESCTSADLAWDPDGSRVHALLRLDRPSNRPRFEWRAWPVNASGGLGAPDEILGWDSGVPGDDVLDIVAWPVTLQPDAAVVLWGMTKQGVIQLLPTQRVFVPALLEGGSFEDGLPFGAVSGSLPRRIGVMHEFGWSGGATHSDVRWVASDVRRKSVAAALWQRIAVHRAAEEMSPDAAEDWPEIASIPTTGRARLIVFRHR